MRIFYAILFLGVVAGIVYRTQYKIRKYYSGNFYVKEIKKEGWFKKVYMISSENGNIDGAVIRENIKDITDSLYYICGPEAMKNNVKKTLHSLFFLGIFDKMSSSRIVYMLNACRSNSVVE